MFALRLQKILPLPAGLNWMKPTGTSAACLVSVCRSVSNPRRSSAVSGKLDVGTSDWPGERDDGWAGAAVPAARLGCQTPSQSELRSPNRSGSQFTRGGIHRRSALQTLVYSELCSSSLNFMDCVKVTAGSFRGSRTNYNHYFSYLKCARDVFVQIRARCNRFLWLRFGLHQFLPQKDLLRRNQQIIFRGGLMAFSLIPPSDLICNLWKEFCEIFSKKTIKQRRREVRGSTTANKCLRIQESVRDSVRLMSQQFRRKDHFMMRSIY